MNDFANFVKRAEAVDFLGSFRDIVSEPLNLAIESHTRAGFIESDFMIFHNGNKVPVNGETAYYGYFSQILIINRGVHEPLEDYVFQEVLKVISPSPIMLELNAHWGHYSMWFKARHPKASVDMIESESLNIRARKENIARNNLQGIYLE